MALTKPKGWKWDDLLEDIGYKKGMKPEAVVDRLIRRKNSKDSSGASSKNGRQGRNRHQTEIGKPAEETGGKRTAGTKTDPGVLLTDYRTPKIKADVRADARTAPAKLTAEDRVAKKLDSLIYGTGSRTVRKQPAQKAITTAADMTPRTAPAAGKTAAGATARTESVAEILKRASGTNEELRTAAGTMPDVRQIRESMKPKTEPAAKSGNSPQAISQNAAKEILDRLAGGSGKNTGAAGARIGGMQPRTAPAGSTAGTAKQAGVSAAADILRQTAAGKQSAGTGKKNIIDLEAARENMARKTVPAGTAAGQELRNRIGNAAQIIGKQNTDRQTARTAKTGTAADVLLQPRTAPAGETERQELRNRIGNPAREIGRQGGQVTPERTGSVADMLLQPRTAPAETNRAALRNRIGNPAQTIGKQNVDRQAVQAAGTITAAEQPAGRTAPAGATAKPELRNQIGNPARDIVRQSRDRQAAQAAGVAQAADLSLQRRTEPVNQYQPEAKSPEQIEEERVRSEKAMEGFRNHLLELDHERRGQEEHITMGDYMAMDSREDRRKAGEYWSYEQQKIAREIEEYNKTEEAKNFQKRYRAWNLSPYNNFSEFDNWNRQVEAFIGNGTKDSEYARQLYEQTGLDIRPELCDAMVDLYNSDYTDWIGYRNEDGAMIIAEAVYRMLYAGVDQDALIRAMKTGTNNQYGNSNFMDLMTNQLMYDWDNYEKLTDWVMQQWGNGAERKDNFLPGYADSVKRESAPGLLPDDLAGRNNLVNSRLSDLKEANDYWDPINDEIERLEAGADLTYFDKNPGHRLSEAVRIYNSLDVTYDIDSVYDRAKEFWNLNPNMDPLYYLTGDQWATFYSYMNEGKREEANAYLQAISPILNRKLAQRQTYAQTELAKSDVGVVMGLSTIGMNIAGAMDTVGGMIAAALGDRQAQDPNSSWYTAQRYTSTVRDTRGDEWEKSIPNGKFWSGVAYSMADNLAALGIGKFASAEKISIGAVQLVMSTEAAAAEFVDCMNRNMSTTESIFRAVGTGAIEAATERWSLEAMLKPDIKALFGNKAMLAGYLGKVFAAEASEEGASKVGDYIMDNVASAIWDHATEIERDTMNQYNEWMREHPHATESQQQKAYQQAFADQCNSWWRGLFEEMAAGGFAGLGLGGSRVVATAANNIARGAGVKYDGSTRVRNDAGTVNRGGVNSSTEALMKIGLNMKAGTNGNILANEMRTQMDSGKGVSAWQIGNLLTSIEYETAGQVREDARQAAKNVVTENLKRSGMDSAAAGGMADIVLKAKTYGLDALNSRERQALSGNAAAYSIYTAMTEPRQLKKNRLNDFWAKETAGQVRESVNAATAQGRAALEAVNMIENRKAVTQAIRARAGKDMLKGAESALRQNTATDEDIERAAGQLSGRYTDAVANRGTDIEIGRIVGLERGRVQVQFADGITGNLRPSDVKAVKGPAAEILTYMDRFRGMISEQVGGKALAALDASGKAAAPNFARNVWDINMAAHTGAKAMPNTSLPDSVADVIWNTAKAEAQAAEEKRVLGNAVTVTPGKGVAAFDGAQYGTKEWTAKVAELPENVKGMANTLGAIARSAGFRYEFYYDSSEDGRGILGSHEKGVRRINLGAEYKDPITGEWKARNMLAIAAHEDTHWLQENSREGYAQLREFVLNEIRRGGGDISQLVMDTRDRYRKMNPNMSIEEAVYEIVCDGCEYLYTSEKMQKRLAEQDPQLHGKIREFVQKWVGRIATALKGITGSAHVEANYIRDVDEMARIWLGGYDEVIHSYVTRNATDARQQESIRQAGLDTENPYSRKMTDAQRNALAEEVNSVAWPKSWSVAETAEAKREMSYSLAGIRANAGYGADVAKAAAMNREGRSYADILKTTGCIEGYDGRWWKVLDNRNQKLTGDVKPNSEYRLADILDAKELYDAYPQLRDIRVTTSDIAGRGSAANGEIVISNRELKDAAALKSDLDHEIQHEIQRLEKSNMGSSTQFWHNTQIAANINVTNMAAEIFEIEDRYGIDAGTELAWGIPFRKDGSVDYDSPWLYDEEKAKIRTIAAEDLARIRELQAEGDKWGKIIRRSPADLYASTVGETEARHAAQQGDEQYTMIPYANPVTVEDYTPEAAASEYRSYAVADERVRSYLNTWGNLRIGETLDQMWHILAKNNVDLYEKSITPELWKTGVKNADIKKLDALQQEKERWESRQKEYVGLDREDLGAQYVQAWKNWDENRMRDILMEKISGTDGIIPYKAPHWYNSKMHIWVANEIKNGDKNAISIAAGEMARLVPENAVLVPMPPHTGTVTDTTDTMLLAQRISQMTGRPVIKALEGAEHESRRESKMKNSSVKNQIQAADLGFRQVADIPRGTIPMFIDNVVASGITAKAASDAMPGGITLAYAKGIKSAIPGLKSAEPTYWDPQHMYLVPLEERMNINITGVKGVRFSVAAENVGGTVYSADEINRSIELLNEAAQKPVRSFSASAPVQVRNDGLVAVHNLSDRSLQSVLRMGGFPMPSIAVIRDNEPWTAYGDISIFFGKDALDFEDGTVYNGDAYTPTLGDANVSTAEEALNLLRSKQQRDPSKNLSLYTMFSSMKKVASMDEARNKAYQDRGSPEHRKRFRQLTDLSADILNGAEKAMTEQGVPFKRNDAVQLVGVGMLTAAEEMQRQTGLSTEQRYEILQRNIDESFRKAGVKAVNFETDGRGLQDMMLKFIDTASTVGSTEEMIESKPNRILPFSDVQAVVLPDDVDRSLVKELIRAGVGRKSIYAYPAGNSVARNRIMTDLPYMKSGVSFSVEENAGDKINRLRNANNELLNTVKNLNYKQFSNGLLKNLINHKLPKAFEQWLDHKYPEKGNRKVKKHEIIDFIRNDNRMIEQGAKSLSEAWKELSKKETEYTDITGTKITKGNDGVKIKSIKNELFGKDKMLYYKIGDTKTTVMVNDTIVDETFHHNDINPNTIEKVLRNIEPLLKGSIYIGSHQNYKANEGYMHYYIAPVDVNNSARVVMFAVHDPVDINQKKLFKEKAYVAEIKIAEKNGAALKSWAQSGAAGFTSNGAPKASIADMLETVNDDRFRFFNKEALNDKKMSFSIEDSLEDDNADRLFSVDDEGNYPDFDVNQWMMGMQEWNLQTEAEKALLGNYKSLRMKISLDQERQRGYQQKIRELEQIENPTREDKYKLQFYKVRLENAKAAQKADEEKLVQVTSSEGYAGMMYQQRQRMNDFTQGRTQDEVNESVKNMEAAAKTLKADIDKTAEELKALADSQQVRRIRSMMDSKTLDAAAARIRKTYNSTVNKQELMNDLARIRLGIQAGQDMTADIEDLTGRILQSRKSAQRNESLDFLRGVTLRLGKAQLRELTGSNSSIKELRSMLAGSGVKVADLERANRRNATVDAEGNVTAGNAASLDADWNELVSFVPALDHYNGIDTDVSLNQPRAVAEFVMNAMAEQRESGQKEFEGMREELFADIVGNIATIDLNMPADPKARQAIESLNQYVVEMAGKASQATERIRELEGKVEELLKSGRKTAAWSSSLKSDIALAMDYFNKTAKMAIENAKQNKQNEIIQQLKDKHVQEMLKQKEEWRNLVLRDENARRQADANAAARRRMSTVITRINKLLVQESDQQNIPENYKPIARAMLGLFVNNDLNWGGRRLTVASNSTLSNTKAQLDVWEKSEGTFSADEFADNGTDDEKWIADTVQDDLDIIRDAMREWNGRYNGKNKLDSLQQMGRTLERMQEAVSEIYGIIQHARQMDINGRKFQVEEMALRFIDSIRQGTKFKGEMTSAFGKKIANLKEFTVTGNTTPEYFFRQMRNEAMDLVWDDFKAAENRNGTEFATARDKIAEIAEKYHYKQWDRNATHEVKALNGTVNMTVEQMMALWATWNREQTSGPVETHHLERGGLYVAQETKGRGITGRQKTNERPYVMDVNTMQAVAEALTDEQKNYVEDMVHYLSDDMSKLGNEASMRMYGIKKYKEKYYYPIKQWSGVGKFASNSGRNATDDNRSAHKGWTKRKINQASNAIEIGNFTDTVVGHVVEMINYNTMAPSIEAMNKMLNWQTTEWPEPETEGQEVFPYKRNIRAIMAQEYGKAAEKYVENFLLDANGGVAQDPRATMADRLLSVFKKNAVAGSLSVALQQPISYIRAANEINPKYLAAALNPATWKGSYEEMMAHSGVAVIKEMGRFDMGYGASAREYITPEGKPKSMLKAAGEKVSDTANMLPELMDRMTWTRIWSAVKAEQQAQNPGVDTNSDEYWNKVTERFNDVMRRTQVYDSIMVKSSNMRSKSFALKSMTSFMAEPTLTLNVLRDAAMSVKRGDKGAMGKAATAAATYILSAAAQAAVKGLMGAGRKPDKNKNKEENFLYRAAYSLISELNPLGLIPAYSDIVETLTKGDISDDMMTVFGKLYAVEQTFEKATGNTNKYRLAEDTAGQVLQLFTGVPVKNIMRDTRALVNFFAPDSGLTSAMGGVQYARRGTSAAVLKYQTIDTAVSTDLAGLINTWLGDAGYKTNEDAYYNRIAMAEIGGDGQLAEELKEYMLLGKGKEPKSLNEKVRKKIKDMEQITNLEKADLIEKYGANAANYNDMIRDAVDSGEITVEESVGMLKLSDPSDYIKDQLREGNIDAETARRLLKEQNPDKDEDSIWWAVDRIEYEKETGNDIGSTTYYRLWDAMENNKSSEITSAVTQMMEHGSKPANIKGEITKKYKAAYLAADSKGKVRIRDAVQKAYKAMGLTAEDADKAIEKWK